MVHSHHNGYQSIHKKVFEKILYYKSGTFTQRQPKQKSSDTSPNKSDNNSDNIIFYSSDQEDTGITTEYKI